MATEQHSEPVQGEPAQRPVSSPQSSSHTLTIGTNLVFKIQDDSLLVQDGKTNSKKKSRTCGFDIQGLSHASNTESIPLYNILWAEFSQELGTLTIDYAKNVSTTQLRATTLSFAVTSSDSSADDENLYPPPDTLSKWTETLMDRAYGPALRRKRAYVLVNPHAGPGGAQKKWDHEVEPIFKAARMPMTVHTTTFSKEAIDLAINMDIDQFDIVVPCSGDGLPYEVFNGLGKRPDARRALQKIAVAHVPCGSGNGLACNVFGTHRASLAALAIVKGVSTPIDLISITQGDNRSLSFLSQTVGIMAEADLGTEHLRWMGEHRFSYGVVTRILKKKAYPCDLYVKMEIDHKEGVLEHYRRERENSSVGELDKMTTSTGTPVGHDSVAGSETEVAKNEDGLPPLKFGTVRDKVPEGWKKIDADHMGNFFCGNVAYMAPDVIFFNAACFSDGFMDLIMVDADVPVSKVPGLLLSVGNNSFFDNPLVKYYKISAFRIIPKYEKDPYISIDGEQIPFEPFQAEVHQGLGMVITKRGIMESPGPRNWDKVTASQRYMP